MNAGALSLDGMDDYISTAFVLNPADGAFSAVAWIISSSPGQIDDVRIYNVALTADKIEAFAR